MTITGRSRQAAPRSRPKTWRAAITDKTRLLVLNSPFQPDGDRLLPGMNSQPWVSVLERHPQVFVVSDDIYEHIMFRGQEFVQHSECGSFAGRPHPDIERSLQGLFHDGLAHRLCGGTRSSSSSP